MGIFNEFFKKEKPVFTGIARGFGFGSGGGGAADAASGSISATGGSGTFTQGGYKVHYYYTTTPGPQSTFNVTSGTGDIECFLVGSGGSGAYDSGGGGGGGACVYGTGIPVNPSMDLAVTVGAAPNRMNAYLSGPNADWAGNYNGKPSNIAHPGGAIHAYGGNSGGIVGPGSGYAEVPFTRGVADAGNGAYGCGGGALRSSGMGPNSTEVTADDVLTPYPVPSDGTFNVYRNKGGSVPTSASGPWISGGGGGAGAVGGNAGPRSSHPGQSAGDGGAGYDAATNITWMTTSYGDSGVFGGGGGAGANDGSPQEPGGAGGPGGGGGGTESGDAPPGTANTGGGGGGVDQADTAGAGGTGAVFIAYQV